MKPVIQFDRHREPAAALYLRLGLIFVFVYVPVASYLDPGAYYHYLPNWVTSLVPPTIALDLLGVFELTLSAWLIWGRWLFVPSLLAAAALLGIIAFNMSSFSVVFRNVTIIFAALALASLSRQRETEDQLDRTATDCQNNKNAIQ